MLKKRSFFWWGLPLCLLIAAAWGYYWFNKPHESAAGETPVVTISADSLLSQYQRDEHGADARYLGKVIEVSGKLGEIQHNGKSEIWILSAQSGAGGINCELFTPDKDAEAVPKPGDNVTIKGKCTGFLLDVNLSDCVPGKQ